MEDRLTVAAHCADFARGNFQFRQEFLRRFPEEKTETVMPMGEILQRPLGGILLSALRCLAIIALVEAVRVAQIPHSIMRIILIIAAQYIICSVGVLAMFAMTIREAVLFVSWCTAGAALLWVGAHIGIWIS